jgi:hypothetical protein
LNTNDEVWIDDVCVIDVVIEDAMVSCEYSFTVFKVDALIVPDDKIPVLRYATWAFEDCIVSALRLDVLI